MLGMPADSEEECLATPETEPKLPLKPQKTLITSFFKQKECLPKKSNTQKDLFGYLKKSSNSQGQETVCENGMNDSFCDFQDPPPKITVNNNKIKDVVRSGKVDKKSRLKVSNKNDQSKGGNNQKQIGQLLNDADKCHEQVMEISYADFLKEEKSEDIIQDAAKGNHVQTSNSVEISYADFLKSQELDSSTEENVLNGDISPIEVVVSDVKPISKVISLEVPNCNIKDDKALVTSANDSDSNGNKSSFSFEGEVNVKVNVESLSKHEVPKADCIIEEKKTSVTDEKVEALCKTPTADKSKIKRKGNIASFFTKLDSKDGKKKKGSTVITTKAVVHHIPGEAVSPQSNKSQQEGKRSPVGKSNVAVENKDMDWTITQLGSVIIETVESKSSENKLKVQENKPKDPEVTGSIENNNTTLATTINVENNTKSPEITILVKNKADSSDALITSENKSEVELPLEDKILNPDPTATSITPTEIVNNNNLEVTPVIDLKASTFDMPMLLVGGKIADKNCSTQEVRIETEVKDSKCISKLDVTSPIAKAKRKQVTLSFSSVGLVLGKPQIIETAKSVEIVKQMPEPKPPIIKCSTPCRKTISDNNVSTGTKLDFTNLDDSPVVQRQKKRSRIDYDCSTPKKDIDNTKSDQATPKNLNAMDPLNSVFESSIVRTPRGKRRVIVRFKFKRFKSNSDEEFTSPTSKLKKRTTHCAQKLLLKARSKKLRISPLKATQRKKAGTKKPLKAAITKKVKPKVTLVATKLSEKSSKAVSSEEDVNVPLRRSSRSSAKVAMAAISNSFEEKHQVKKMADKAADRKTIKKAKMASTKEKKGAPEKKVTKMAPIFFGKKTSHPASEPITISDDDEEEEDPEVVRVRKQFLMSGVPTELRKQQVLCCGEMTTAEYPPFPTNSHVVQREHITDIAALDPWSLPDVSLNLKVNTSDPQVVAKPWCSGTLTKTEKLIPKPTVCDEKKDCALLPLDEAVLPYLLGEISRYNAAYPVRRVFKKLQKVNTELKTAILKMEDHTDIIKEDPVMKEVKAKGKKRKDPEPESPHEMHAQQSKRHRGSAESSQSRLSTRHSERIPKAKDEEIEVVDVEQWENQSGLATNQNIKTNNEQHEDLLLNDTLWTEKYEPKCAADVLGNSTCVKKLKTWLVEWKQRTDLELKRLRKLILKKAKRAGKSREEIKKEIKKKLGTDWLVDDEDDFELDDEDSDSEYEEAESGLCNSKLLTGPHGVGKTATVYALAKELGYKVFEVNASSQRSGRQMLARLQEATQSHQVSQKNMDTMFTTSMAAQAIVEKVPPPKQDKKLTGFANLFGKAKQKTDSKPTVKTKKDANKKTTPDDLPTPECSRRGLDLSSTCLVLFEEVDIIFEEDKGFWTAIQTFMGTTKRPIIFTSSTESVSRLMEARHEVLTMCSLPLVNVATHLQLICLVENMRTSFHDIHSLVEFHAGDLRQCLLRLHFWASSNGSFIRTVPAPIVYNQEFMKPKTNQLAPASPMSKLHSPARQVTAVDSSSDFETPPTKRRQRVRNVIDSPLMESPSGSNNPPLMFNEDSQSQSSCVETVAQSQLVTTPEAITAPDVYHISNMAHALPHSIPAGLLQFLVDSVTNPCVGKISSLAHYKGNRINILYANLTSLLGLPCMVPFRRPSSAILGVKSKVRRRIKCVTELFSTDESDTDNFITLKKKSKNTEKDVDCTVDPGTPSGLDSCDVKNQDVDLTEKRILLSSIQALSDMYDAVSFSDAYLHIGNEFLEGPCNASPHLWTTGTIAPGLCDSGTRYVKTDQTDIEVINEAACAANLAAVSRCRTQLSKCITKMEHLNAESKEIVTEQLSLPQEGTELRLSEEFSLYKNLEGRHQKAYQHICSILPHHVQLEKRALACDYIPSLQTICHSEQLRKATNTKRRFLHYTDAISLNITSKANVMDTLCSSFV